MSNENNLMADAEMIESLLHSLLGCLTSGSNNESIADLPLAQLRLCNALCGKARSMSSVSKDLGTSLSAVTQIADRLERSGLVKRVARSDDRRVRCLKLTGRGEEMMRLHKENRVGRMADVVAGLSPEQRKIVTAAFETLVEAAKNTIGRKDQSKTLKVHFDTSKVMI